MKEHLQHLRNNGFVFIKQLSCETATVDVARLFGVPVNFSGRAIAETLTPRHTSEAPSNTYGGIYGLGEYPLHTDMAIWHQPPRYFLLRCIVGAPNVYTFIVSPKFAIEQIGFG